MIKLRPRQAGYTVIELLMAVAIAGILATVLLSVSLGYYSDIIRSNQTTELYVEAHYALRSMIEDVRLADSINITPALTDANAPSGGWTTSDANNVLIIGAPTIDSSQNIIYDTATGNPYKNEYIYFIQNGSLFKRTLKNTNAFGNIAKTSCPASLASSSCPVDKTYSTHANNFTLAFYDVNNATTNDPASARSVKISLQLSRKSFGKTITVNDTILATLRNK